MALTHIVITEKVNQNKLHEYLLEIKAMPPLTEALK